MASLNYKIKNSSLDKYHGWLSPNGEYFHVGHREHEKFSYQKFNKSIDQLKDMGWVHLPYDPCYWIPLDDLTMDQYDFMEKYNYDEQGWEFYKEEFDLKPLRNVATRLEELIKLADYFGLKENNHGWLSPTGRYYHMDHMEHDSFARKVLEKEIGKDWNDKRCLSRYRTTSEMLVEELGWVHLPYTSLYWIPLDKMSMEQYMFMEEKNKSDAFWDRYKKEMEKEATASIKKRDKWR